MALSKVCCSLKRRLVCWVRYFWNRFIFDLNVKNIAFHVVFKKNTGRWFAFFLTFNKSDLKFRWERLAVAWRYLVFPWRSRTTNFRVWGNWVVLTSALCRSFSSLQWVEIEALLFICVTSTKSRRAWRFFVGEISILDFFKLAAQLTPLISKINSPIHLLYFSWWPSLAILLLLSGTFPILFNLPGQVICLDSLHATPSFLGLSYLCLDHRWFFSVSSAQLISLSASLLNILQLPSPSVFNFFHLEITLLLTLVVMMFLLFFMMLFIMNDCCLVSPQRGRVEVANESRRLARVTIIRIVDGWAMIGTVKALRNKVKWK